MTAPLPLEQLKRRLHDAYGAVEHLQTHISHVLLAGDYAFKIKKPVNFGFLDFTDLAQRQFFCQEELRLNRRLAPALYLGLMGLDATGRLSATAAAGDEPVVQMRRFDQNARLDQYAARQGLTDAQVDGMARQIERFHAEAAVAPQDSHFGSPETVYFPIRQNFEQIRGFAISTDDAALIGRIESASQQAFEQLKPLIARRKQQGFVREGHGDMHLGNMALIDDAVVIFDAIEFNADFRWSDTANDLAFLWMDLTDRGLLGAARRLLNTYLEASGDYEALLLLKFYGAYRAMVRAKIALFELRPELTDDEAARQWATFRRYARLAEQFFNPTTPTLWLTLGFSGSGKSLAAMELVTAMGAVRVRSDAERQRRYIERMNRYSQEASAAVYAELLRIAELGLSAGWSMVIDATFLKQAQRQPFWALGQRLGLPVHLLFIECDVSTLRRYLAERAAAGSDISEADETVLASQMQQLEPLTAEERARSFRLRCDAPFGGQVADVLAALPAD
ncbi:AAA family ATPase [Halothiobacillus sp. DCM-1]|uniref:bifunctional aminoglycoside phosphotransferase/ATP-binding protein n=1 Tax=Halothiobacillus sp. DCM-1 TaxID=3112558 RepID=UPI003252FD32